MGPPTGTNQQTGHSARAADEDQVEARAPDPMPGFKAAEDRSVPDKQISRWTGEGGLASGRLTHRVYLAPLVDPRHG